jgi:hypothetical protein
MKCERCNRKLGNNPAGVSRLTEVTIKGRRATFCDGCRTITAAVHKVTDPRVVEVEAEPDVDDEDEWVHKGGGYYENSVTGETRRGRPEEDEDDEEGEGEAAE